MRDPAKWHLFQNPSEQYLTQFTSEHKVLLRNHNTGAAKEVWQKKRAASANHFLDAEVYAMAAADIIRALNIRASDAVVTHEPSGNDWVGKSGWFKRKRGSWI